MSKKAIHQSSSAHSAGFLHGGGEPVLKSEDHDPQVMSVFMQGKQGQGKQGQDEQEQGEQAERHTVTESQQQQQQHVGIFVPPVLCLYEPSPVVLSWCDELLAYLSYHPSQQVTLIWGRDDRSIPGSVVERLPTTHKESGGQDRVPDHEESAPGVSGHQVYIPRLPREDHLIKVRGFFRDLWAHRQRLALLSWHDVTDSFFELGLCTSVIKVNSPWQWLGFRGMSRGYVPLGGVLSLAIQDQVFRRNFWREEKNYLWPAVRVPESLPVEVLRVPISSRSQYLASAFLSSCESHQSSWPGLQITELREAEVLSSSRWCGVEGSGGGAGVGSMVSDAEQWLTQVFRSEVGGRGVVKKYHSDIWGADFWSRYELTEGRETDGNHDRRGDDFGGDRSGDSRDDDPSNRWERDQVRWLLSREAEISFVSSWYPASRFSSPFYKGHHRAAGEEYRFELTGGSWWPPEQIPQRICGDGCRELWIEVTACFPPVQLIVLWWSMGWRVVCFSDSGAILARRLEVAMPRLGGLLGKELASALASDLLDASVVPAVPGVTAWYQYDSRFSGRGSPVRMLFRTSREVNVQWCDDLYTFWRSGHNEDPGGGGDVLRWVECCEVVQDHVSFSGEEQSDDGEKTQQTNSPPTRGRDSTPPPPGGETQRGASRVAHEDFGDDDHVRDYLAALLGGSVVAVSPADEIPIHLWLRGQFFVMLILESSRIKGGWRELICTLGAEGWSVSGEEDEWTRFLSHRAWTLLSHNSSDSHDLQLTLWHRSLHHHSFPWGGSWSDVLAWRHEQKSFFIPSPDPPARYRVGALMSQHALLWAVMMARWLGGRLGGRQKKVSGHSSSAPCYLDTGIHACIDSRADIFVRDVLGVPYRYGSLGEYASQLGEGLLEEYCHQNLLPYWREDDVRGEIVYRVILNKQ